MAHRTDRSLTQPVHTTVELPTTIGLDLSDRISHFHVQRGDGVTLETGKVSNTTPDLSAFFERYRGCRLVLETGGHSPWISRLGEFHAMEVVVANARRVELIKKSDHKTDRSDAKLLAEIGRTNKELLSPITHRSQAAQAELCVLRARDELVSSRTALVNHVRGVLKSNGHRAPSCSADSFDRKAAESIPAILEPGLRPVMKMLTALRAEIAALDAQIEELCTKRHPITQVLRQIGGVGPVVALTFVLTLDDPSRFKSPRDIGSYLGLVPRQRSSGASDPQLHVTKAGDRSMRRLLVIAANYILGCFGPDCDLRRFGLKIAREGNDRIAKRKARVAVARKLAVLMHHLWRTHEVYDPFHTAKKRGELAAV